MTEQKAIKWLKTFKGRYGLAELEESVDMAIQVLEQTQWIPISERLPEENTDVLLGLRNGDKFKCFVSRRVDYNYWVGLGRDVSDEIRWMPLPESYMADREDSEDADSD